MHHPYILIIYLTKNHKHFAFKLTRRSDDKTVEARASVAHDAIISVAIRMSGEVWRDDCQHWRQYVLSEREFAHLPDAGSTKEEIRDYIRKCGIELPERHDQPYQMPPVSYDIPEASLPTIKLILDRVQLEFPTHDLSADRVGMERALSACHANGNPLDFQKLLDFDNFNFSYDIFNIYNHLDRQTGKLIGIFSPLCSA